MPSPSTKPSVPRTSWKNWLWLVILMLVVYAVNTAILALMQLASAAARGPVPLTRGAFGFSAAEWSTALAYAWPRAALGWCFIVAGMAGLILIRRRSARAAAGQS